MRLEGGVRFLGYSILFLMAWKSAPRGAARAETEPQSKTPSYTVRSKIWTLQATGGASATIAPEEGKRDTFRVTIADAPEPAWTIQLTSDPFSVREKQAYQLSFRARADKPRTIICMVSMNQPPWSSVGLYRDVSLTDEWQEFSFPFVGTADEKNARICFNFGGDATSLEIAEIAINGDWKLISREGSEAKLTRFLARPEQVRADVLKLGGGNAGQVQLVREEVPVTEKQLYTLGFRARASKPRSMIASIGRNSPPWSGYGVYQEVALTDSWQAFQLPFRAAGTDDKARIVFELGGSDGAVEIADLSLLDGQWTLTSSDGAAAALLQPMDVPGLIVVAIEKAGESPRAVQLFQPSVGIVKNRNYVATFAGRATAPRPINVSVSRGMAPWDSLGLSAGVRLTPEWVRFRLSFEGASESSSSRLVFDLGASSESVELRDVNVGEEDTSSDNP